MVYVVTLFTFGKKFYGLKCEWGYFTLYGGKPKKGKYPPHVFDAKKNSPK